MNLNDYGACVLRECRYLTESQNEAFYFIFNGIHQHSDEEYRRAKRQQENLSLPYFALAEQDKVNINSRYADNIYRRPHKVFVINGKRGSGKTSLLLSLHNIFFTPYCDSIDEIFRAGKPDRQSLKHKLSLDNTISTALTLPIIMPNELEHSENTLECILSHIDMFLDNKRNDIEQLIVNEHSSPAKRTYDSEHHHRSILTQIEKLRSTMRQDIGSGWAFSHKIGLEVLSRDANNFNEYIDMRAEQAKTSYNRISAWRQFVCEFLDTFNAQSLLIFIDDTDMSYKITSDILQTIRLYLSHPRIITVISMNVDYILHSLEMQTMANIDLGKHVDVHGDRYKQIVQRETKGAYDYFYKVVPPPLWSNLRVTRSDRQEIFQRYLGLPETTGINDYFKDIINGLITNFQDQYKKTESELNKFLDTYLAGDKTDDASDRTDATPPSSRDDTNSYIVKIAFENQDEFNRARKYRNWCCNYAILIDYHEDLIGKTIRDIKFFARELANSSPTTTNLPNTSPFIILSKRPSAAIIKSRYLFDIRDIEGSIKKWNLALDILSPSFTEKDHPKQSITETDTEFQHIAYYFDVYFTKHMTDLAPHEWRFLVPDEVYRYPFFSKTKYRQLYQFTFLGVSKLFFDSYIPINCLNFSDLLKVIETIKDDVDAYSPGTSKLVSLFISLNNILQGQAPTSSKTDTSTDEINTIITTLRTILYSMRLAVAVPRSNCHKSLDPIILQSLMNLFPQPASSSGRTLHGYNKINLAGIAKMIMDILSLVCTHREKQCENYQHCLSVKKVLHTRNNIHLLHSLTFSISMLFSYIERRQRQIYGTIAGHTTKEKEEAKQQIARYTQPIFEIIRSKANHFKKIYMFPVDELSSSIVVENHSLTVHLTTRKLLNTITNEVDRLLKSGKPHQQSASEHKC